MYNFIAVILMAIIVWGLPDQKSENNTVRAFQPVLH
jgi:hypothetical protein